MLNKVILMGRLTADPEAEVTNSNIGLTTFTLAVERNRSKEREKVTDFISCVAWRQTAEFISKYFKKGSMICVEGSVQVRRYEDKQGNKRTAVDVIVEESYFASNKAPPQIDIEKDKPNNYTNSNTEFSEINEFEDDLPF